MEKKPPKPLKILVNLFVKPKKSSDKAGGAAGGGDGGSKSAPIVRGNFEVGGEQRKRR